MSSDSTVLSDERDRDSVAEDGGLLVLSLCTDVLLSSKGAALDAQVGLDLASEVWTSSNCAKVVKA